MWHSEPSSLNCSMQVTFSFYMQPAEHFFMLMRPLSEFEFETPGLNLVSNTLKYPMCFQLFPIVSGFVTKTSLPKIEAIFWYVPFGYLYFLSFHEDLTRIGYRNQSWHGFETISI